jgi:hypothetical protein
VPAPERRPAIRPPAARAPWSQAAIAARQSRGISAGARTRCGPQGPPGYPDQSNSGADDKNGAREHLVALSGRNCVSGCSGGHPRSAAVIVRGCSTAPDQRWEQIESARMECEQDFQADRDLDFSPREGCGGRPDPSRAARVASAWVISRRDLGRLRGSADPIAISASEAVPVVERIGSRTRPLRGTRRFAGPGTTTAQSARAGRGSRRRRLRRRPIEWFAGRLTARAARKGQHSNEMSTRQLPRRFARRWATT